MGDAEIGRTVSEGDVGTSDADVERPDEEAELRRATGLAVAAAGVSVIGFVSLFRLRVGWDRSRPRAFRRFLGVLAESLIGVGLGYRSLNRLRAASNDKRGVPFAVIGIVLGVSNLARAIFWLRQDGAEV